MFGWHPKLAIDILLGTRPKDGCADKQTYAQKLCERIQFAYKKATEEAARNAEKSKQLYDRKVSASKLETGDRVLVRLVGHQGKHKLADRWEELPYRVLIIPNPDLPVYEIQREDGQGPLMELHRNMLLQFNVMPPALIPVNQRENLKVLPKSRTRKTRPVTSYPFADSDSQSSSDFDFPRYTIPQRRTAAPGCPTAYHSVPSSATQSPVLQPSPEHSAISLPRPGSSLNQPNCTIRYFSLVNGPTPPNHETVPQQSVNLPDSQVLFRSERTRKPPDRYGQWVIPIQWSGPAESEYFV